MEDTDFSIVETKSNGDCFFDSIYKGMNKNQKYSVKNQRELLSDTVNEGDFSFWRILYDNAYKENDSEILEEYDFMEDLLSLDQLKQYVKEPSFWANSWAIGVIEKQLNIKTVIFNELMYLRDNLDNVVQCGDMAMEYTVPKCEYCSLTKTDYDESKQTINEHKTTLGDHHWIESKTQSLCIINI